VKTPNIAEILDRHPRDRTGLMDILWDVQRRYSYIPPEAARTIARRLGLSPEDVRRRRVSTISSTPAALRGSTYCTTSLALLPGPTAMRPISAK
jgi:NADH:ubiquinone oxidoreductase subunit E